MNNAATASPLTIPAVNYYQMVSTELTVSSIDGNKVGMDSTGRINQVEYANGSTVRRLDSYVLVRSETSAIWFGDKRGHWFLLD